MLKNCCKSLIGILIASVCIEIILRIITPLSQPLRFYTQYSKKTARNYLANITSECKLVPGSLMNGFIINTQGNYSPEYPFDKPPNTKRIVVIGDSAVTAVVPYTKSFVRVVEQQLKTKTDTQIQFVNLGMPCIGPAIEKEILTDKGIHYEPDLILLVFSVSNDFVDDQSYADTPKEQRRPESPLQKIIRQSYLASFLKTQYFLRTSPNVNLQNTSNTTATAGTYVGTEYDATTPTFSEENYINLTNTLADILIPNSIPTARVASVQQPILEMKKIADNLHAKFLVLLIPAEFQVNMELLASAAARMNRVPSDFDIFAPQTILKTFFHQNDIQYMDIASFWQDDPNRQYYYHPRDTHLNIEGNDSVANALTPIITSLLDLKN